MTSGDISKRVWSVDVLRGLVMVLMAIDHVRVYAAVPAFGTTTGLFLTRWITHFCAPVFAFLAGASIFLRDGESPDKDSASKRLLMRGGMLVLLELTLLRWAWTFNFDFERYMLAGVIWMLGWCMIFMAGAVRLPVWVNAAVGVAMIAGHNGVASALQGSRDELLKSDMGWLWRILYFGGGIRVGESAKEPNFLVLYSLIPWIGVMMAGYAFGAVLKMDSATRDRWCVRLGGGATALFLLLRFFNVYGDFPWGGGDELPAWMAFLNASKYPASFLFLLMTLGPSILAMPTLDRVRGGVGNVLSLFGRSPMLYYVLHIPVIHLLAIAVALVRTPADVGWLFNSFPMRPSRPPEGYMWSLGLLYAVTAAAVVLLYFACNGLSSRLGKARRASG